MSSLSTIQLAGKEIDHYARTLVEVIDGLTEDQLWSTSGGLPNSIGNITRHLTGNLNHYFGKGILKNDYRRVRDLEFTEKRIPKGQVIDDLKAAVDIAIQAINSIDENQLDLPYISPDGELSESLAYHILHMTTHFSLHVGQADFAKTLLQSV